MMIDLNQAKVVFQPLPASKNFVTYATMKMHVANSGKTFDDLEVSAN